MKIKKTLKKILTLFCASIILFSAAGCGEGCADVKDYDYMIHYSFDTFKDFSEFHSQFAAL